ncbi:hypothetical protein C1N71_14150 [Agrococcus sp. SGAir0287]|nr:hypothetical protein C1N71_14150 [Agrococcus sp. SGAir0287]
MRTIGLAAMALAATSTASCSAPLACPTVGYSSTLTVELAEPRDDIALELCVTEGCSPRARDDLPADEPIVVCETLDCVTATPTPDEPARADDGIWMLEGDGVDGWSVTIMTGGEVVAYRLVASDGVVLDEGEVTPDWERVGGSEQCGGPREAEVVLG